LYTLKTKIDTPTHLDEVITKVLTQMSETNSGTPEFAAMADQLTKLYKLKEIEISEPCKPGHVGRRRRQPRRYPDDLELRASPHRDFEGHRLRSEAQVTQTDPQQESNSRGHAREQLLHAFCFLANRRNYKDYSETPTKGPSMLKKLIRAFQHSIAKSNTAIRSIVAVMRLAMECWNARISFFNMEGPFVGVSL